MVAAGASVPQTSCRQRPSAPGCASHPRSGATGGWVAPPTAAAAGTMRRRPGVRRGGSANNGGEIHRRASVRRDGTDPDANRPSSSATAPDITTAELEHVLVLVARAAPPAALGEDALECRAIRAERFPCRCEALDDDLDRRVCRGSRRQADTGDEVAHTSDRGATEPTVGRSGLHSSGSLPGVGESSATVAEVAIVHGSRRAGGDTADDRLWSLPTRRPTARFDVSAVQPPDGGAPRGGGVVWGWCGDGTVVDPRWPGDAVESTSGPSADPPASDAMPRGHIFEGGRWTVRSRLGGGGGPHGGPGRPVGGGDGPRVVEQVAQVRMVAHLLGGEFDGTASRPRRAARGLVVQRFHRALGQSRRPRSATGKVSSSAAPHPQLAGGSDAPRPDGQPVVGSGAGASTAAAVSCGTVLRGPAADHDDDRLAPPAGQALRADAREPR